MAVNTEHGEYGSSADDWTLLEDVHNGEKAIKAAGSKYLPILGGQGDAEYNAYKMRGSFFNAFARTVQSLIGLVFRKPVEVEVPEGVLALLPSIMSTGQNFDSLSRATAINVLKLGRVGLLVDAQDDARPYVAVYQAKHITNWRTEFVNGEEKLTMLVLKESASSIDAANVFETKEVDQYRSFELFLDEKDNNTKVEVNVWQKNNKDKFAIIDTIHPKIQNKFLDEIMFFPIGPEENTMQINKPPLLDMANISISHWRLSVDYHHGLHFASLPTPWAAGFDSDQTLAIGPVQVWRADDANASCGFLEFTGQGLDSIAKAIADNEEKMAILGARIIEQTRSKVETAEAARIRQSGESGTLILITNNISAGLTKALQAVSRWVGSTDTDDVVVKLSTDFVDSKLSPQDLSALLQTYQGGGMSLDTFLWNLQQGERLPSSQTVEDEKNQIKSDGEDSFETDDLDDDLDV